MQVTKSGLDQSLRLGQMIERLPEDKNRVALLKFLAKAGAPVDIRAVFSALAMRADIGSEVLGHAATDRLVEIKTEKGAYLADLTPFGREVLASLGSSSAAA